MDEKGIHKIEIRGNSWYCLCGIDGSGLNWPSREEALKRGQRHLDKERRRESNAARIQVSRKAR